MVSDRACGDSQWKERESGQTMKRLVQDVSAVEYAAYGCALDRYDFRQTRTGGLSPRGYSRDSEDGHGVDVEVGAE